MMSEIELANITRDILSALSRATEQNASPSPDGYIPRVNARRASSAFAAARTALLRALRFAASAPAVFAWHLRSTYLATTAAHTARCVAYPPPESSSHSWARELNCYFVSFAVKCSFNSLTPLIPPYIAVP